jgi:hypothetical protein
VRGCVTNKSASEGLYYELRGATPPKKVKGQKHVIKQDPPSMARSRAHSRRAPLGAGMSRTSWPTACSSPVRSMAQGLPGAAPAAVSRRLARAQGVSGRPRRACAAGRLARSGAYFATIWWSLGRGGVPDAQPEALRGRRDCAARRVHRASPERPQPSSAQSLTRLPSAKDQPSVAGTGTATGGFAGDSFCHQVNA